MNLQILFSIFLQNKNKMEVRSVKVTLKRVVKHKNHLLKLVFFRLELTQFLEPQAFIVQIHQECINQSHVYDNILKSLIDQNTSKKKFDFHLWFVGFSDMAGSSDGTRPPLFSEASRSTTTAEHQIQGSRTGFAESSFQTGRQGESNYLNGRQGENSFRTGHKGVQSPADSFNGISYGTNYVHNNLQGKIFLYKLNFYFSKTDVYENKRKLQELI